MSVSAITRARIEPTNLATPASRSFPSPPEGATATACTAAADRQLKRHLARTFHRLLTAPSTRWGYRRSHARLLERGWSVDRKRVQRLLA